VVSALALQEDAPGSLGAALALTEALDAADDPDTRVLALTSYLEQLPEPRPLELRGALARALLDAGAAAPALSLCQELTREAPDDPGPWESLRVAARLLGDYEQVVVACERLAERVNGAQRAALLEEAAAVLHERLERREAAEHLLRAVLTSMPDREPAFERLHDVLVEREDLDGLLALLAQRVAITGSSSERVDLLYERARILRARGERDAALAAAEQLLAEAPQHAGALGLCAEIHATGENWLGAVEALRRLAETELTPAQRRLSLEGAADFLEQKLGDELGAYRELEKLLAHDLADHSVHLRMAKLAESAGLLQPAAAALVRAAALSRGAKRAQLERKAAALYQKVDQPENARSALRRALWAHPSDELALHALYPQLIAPDERERLAARFVEALFVALASDPLDAELQRCLVRTGALLARPVFVIMGLYALQALGHATDDELAAAEGLRRARASRALGASPRWNETNFGLLVPRELSGDVLALGQNLSAAWLEVAPDAPEKHGLRRRSRLGSREPHPLREALKTALAAFGLSLQDSFGSEREPHALYPLRQPGAAQSWVIGREVSARRLRASLLKALPLMAASRAQLLGLWEEDPGKLRARAVLLLGAAGALVNGPLEDEPLSTETAVLAPKLPRARRAALVQAWTRLTDPEEALLQLAHGAVLLGQRAALIACGDLVELTLAHTARAHGAHGYFATPLGRDLLAFWLSPACAELLSESEVSA
jgi:tetratricopeptide (TPR) repeat protein